MNPVWNDRSISLSSKIRLVHSIVTSICMYACESWTLTAELQRKIRAMEMRCCHRILHISHKDHITYEEVRDKIQQAIEPHENLLTIVKRCKLQRYGHISLSSDLVKTILQGTVTRGKKTRQTEEEVGRQHQGIDRPGVRQAKNGGNWLRNHLWCPTTLTVKGYMLLLLLLLMMMMMMMMMMKKLFMCLPPPSQYPG